ncbi:carboxylesterase family protein [Chitinophaga rhizophila]|uniref:Alpha/beta hydrolase n=1 Tax=Chitinophaga rhizophila TaxID=2866212 RepID=A0ABS7GBL6_9BACT|nr:alpha/beta hydrolase [Chitinophaga rhizophila]MBW8685073.1 alpha/beta hydrolase [Chitinophaga rhizophila]
MKRVLLLLFFCPLFAMAQTIPDYSAFSYEVFSHNGDSLRYRMLLPEGYDAHKAYPLIMFLHGSGERGADNAAQLVHGGKLFLKDSVRKGFPAIVIFPQCPADSMWSTMIVKRDASGKAIDRSFSDATDKQATPGALVMMLTDSLVKAGKADSKRLYLGGLSLGAIGTFDILARYPDTWAAAFPICGVGNVDNAAKFSKVPMWIFHGAADNVVLPAGSRNYYEALKKLKADVKYTEYPGVGHNSWDNAFAEPQLLPWLFSHKKK